MATPATLLGFTSFHHTAPQMLVGLPGDCCYGPVITVTATWIGECVGTASSQICTFSCQISILFNLTLTKNLSWRSDFIVTKMCTWPHIFRFLAAVPWAKIALSCAWLHTLYSSVPSDSHTFPWRTHWSKSWLKSVVCISYNGIAGYVKLPLSKLLVLVLLVSRQTNVISGDLWTFSACFLVPGR